MVAVGETAEVEGATSVVGMGAGLVVVGITAEGCGLATLGGTPGLGPPIGRGAGTPAPMRCGAVGAGAAGPLARPSGGVVSLPSPGFGAAGVGTEVEVAGDPT